MKHYTAQAAQHVRATLRKAAARRPHSRDTCSRVSNTVNQDTRYGERTKGARYTPFPLLGASQTQVRAPYSSEL